jgi:imidazolonepropionase-like amidohydrolase
LTPTHLAFRTIGDGDWQHAGLTDLPGQLALLGAAHAQQTLEAGFTTVRVVGTGHFNDIALRNAISSGWIPGPRILGAGTSFGITGGHCDDLEGYNPGVFGRESGIADGAADGVDRAREAVRCAVKYGPTGSVDGAPSLTDRRGQQYSEEEMRDRRTVDAVAPSRRTRMAPRASRRRCAPGSRPSSTDRCSTRRPCG